MKHVDNRHSTYQVYLLRLWRESMQTPWRASLQSTATEQHYHFATVEALFAFLDGQLAQGEDGTAMTEERT